MNKKELVEKLKDIPDNAEIDVYDLRNYKYPNWRLNTTSYFSDVGTPVVVIELT